MQLDESYKYIGDGVYMDVNRFGTAELVTFNGIEITNRIVLEREVYDTLKMMYDKAIKK